MAAAMGSTTVSERLRSILKMPLFHACGVEPKGIVPNSGFQRYSARLKADYQVKPWLKMGGNVSFTHYDSREQDTEGGQFY